MEAWIWTWNHGQGLEEITLNTFAAVEKGVIGSLSIYDIVQQNLGDGAYRELKVGF